MKEVSMRDATSPLAEYVNDLESEPLILTARGKPIAALVSLKGVDAETLAVSTHPGFMRIIRASRRQLRRASSSGGLSANAVRERLGLRTSTKRPRKPAKR